MTIVPPDEGRLAGGDVGAGRLADPERIVAALEAVLGPDDLAGLDVLVTAGGTREPIDPVRFIGNRSSGKQGHALADEAASRGAKVTLVTTVERPAAAGVDVVRVATAAEMDAAVRERSDTADVVVMAAAVADFRPDSSADTKLKKDGRAPTVTLVPTADILGGLVERRRPGQTLVGFAAETDDVEANAAAKLARKPVDLLVVNDVSAARRRVRVGHERGAYHVAVRIDPRPSTSATSGPSPVPSSMPWWPIAPRPEPRSPNTEHGAPVSKFTFTSESVTEGHPDKMADQISDSILDAMLAEDPESRVACETLVTTGLAIVAGEITTKAYVDIPGTVRQTINDIGYDREAFGYDGNTCGVMVCIDEQSPDIAQGVDDSEEVRSGTSGEDLLNKQGAGDQGMMFGYACDETDVLMPLPIHLAHRMAERLTEVRRAGTVPYLRPDGKTQVTFDYEDGKPVRLTTVLVSTQHNDGIDRDEVIRPDLIEHVIRPVIPEQFADDDYEVFVNPTGRFVTGGPRGRRRPDRPQDHRRHLRRHGPPRRRRLLRQGPQQGRPLGRLRRPLGGQEPGRRRRRQPLRGPGGLRHRRGPPHLDHGRDLRHRERRQAQAGGDGP